MAGSSRRKIGRGGKGSRGVLNGDSKQRAKPDIRHRKTHGRTTIARIHPDFPEDSNLFLATDRKAPQYKLVPFVAQRLTKAGTLEPLVLDFKASVVISTLDTILSLE